MRQGLLGASVADSGELMSTHRMTADTVSMKEIDKVLAELFQLDGFFAKEFAGANPVSEKDVAKFEKAVGNKLPEGFRSYTLEYGLGAPIIRADLSHRGRIQSLDLAEQKLALAKEPFAFERTFVEKDGKQKAKISKLVRGGNDSAGTLHLGCPTGTHSNFWLVLNGPHAGEVWKGNFSLAPSKKPMFLSMTLAFLKKELKRARRQSKLGRQLVEGNAEELFAKAKDDKARQALQSDLRSAIKEMTAFGKPSEADYEAISNALPLLGVKPQRVAPMIAMLQGRWEQAESLAKESLELEEGKKNSWGINTAAMHIVFAMAARGEKAPSEVVAPKDAQYGGMFCTPNHLRRVFKAMGPKEQALIKKQVSTMWSEFFDRPA